MATIAPPSHGILQSVLRLTIAAWLAFPVGESVCTYSCNYDNIYPLIVLQGYRQMSVSAISGDGLTARSLSLADNIARLSDTITACDRLCLLGARSVIACAVPEAGKGDEHVIFIPSLSRDIPVGNGGFDYRTTSAQCVAALQSLLPVIGRFRLGSRASKDLAFHPIERDAMKIFEPRQLEGEIRSIIELGLKGLCEPPPSNANGEVSPPAEEAVRSILTSKTFGYLHPFTAAHILRAIAPSHGLYGLVWWRSLFVVLWFLNRRGSSRRGYPNIQTTNSPGTAFLTSQCVDTVDSVLKVFKRRRDRIKKLLDLMDEYNRVGIQIATIEGVAVNGSKPLLEKDLFTAGFKYRQQILGPQIRWCIEELALDGLLPQTYRAWADALTKRKSPDGKENSGDLCIRVLDGFRAA